MLASRLLILGALRTIQPAHGYQIRQELERWEADKWAPVAYGSIYHALNSMQKEGLLEVAVDDVRKGGTEKKMYMLTEQGNATYQILLEKAWLAPQPAYDPMQIALNFRLDIPAGIFFQGLSQKIRATEEAIVHLRKRQTLSPPHVSTNIDLVIRQQEVFVAWAKEIQGK